MATKREVVRNLLDQHGQTYAEQAGIRLSDKPSPLYRLLVLSVLLSARIGADIAVAAARELSAAGFRTPRAMLDATWQQRVDALGRGHYRRYDERTATMLGTGAELILQRWKGDLRRLHDEADTPSDVCQLLREVPGIGPVGAAIFCREVQGVWTDLAPYVDDRTAKGAKLLGLPTTGAALGKYAGSNELPNLIAGCVRASLSKQIVDDVLAR